MENKNKKNNLLNNITRVITLALCLVLITGCVSTIKTKRAAKENAADKNAVQSEEYKTGKTSAQLICAGDNLIHREIANQAKERTNGNGYNFSPAYEEISDIVKGADIAFLNMEIGIVPSQPVSHYPSFNAPPELLDNMIDLGFDVFNQATNHIIDKGASGAVEDYDLFHTKDDIILTGLYKSWDEMFTPQLITKNDITFSFCAFTESLNGNQIPAGNDLGIVSLAGTNHSEEELYGAMEKIIKQNKEVSDVTCVSMHWIDEDITEPDTSQKEIAKKLADYGADIIIGTGPHVLQPIEYIDRADGGKTLVIWSLGNLISTQEYFPNTLGGIADIKIEKDYDAGTVSISSVGFIPTLVHYESRRANVKIMKFDNYTDELAAVHGAGNLNCEKINNFFKEMYGDYLVLNRNDASTTTTTAQDNGTIY